MIAIPLPDPALLKAVEQLDYRATVGDIAAQAGLEINLAERGLLALASQADGKLQVAESGDVVYEFPRNFRDVLRSKSFRLRLKDWWNKVWRVLFYLIRISFGIVLIALIVAVIVGILVVVITTSSNRRDDDDSDRSWGGNWGGSGGIWVIPDLRWIFYPDYDRSPADIHPRPLHLNFLEAVFSFLFGDGNPNADLEEKRWQTIAAVIRNNRGAVVAEQIAPYLDDVGEGYDRDYENYMLPVLTRFDGRPEVTPDGQFAYQFPSLQTTVARSRSQAIPPFLRENLWQFSQAGSGQLLMAGLLGVVLLGASGGLLAIAASAVLKGLAIAGLVYSGAYLTIPALRYFWLKRRNQKVRDRNTSREQRAALLAQNNPALVQKLDYAQQFAAETVIEQDDIIYATDRNLAEQETDQQARIDAEWQRRLEGRN